MNDKDLFNLSENHSSYAEPWQYITWRTTHKSPKKDENDKPILPEDSNDLSTLTVVRHSAHRNKFAVGVKNFTFDELVEATRQGHSLKRIGTNVQGTRFLVIDLDNDGDENITPEELDSFCSDSIRWTPGGSNRPHRYHLFVLLTAPIVTKQEFKEQSEKVLKRLAEHIGLETIKVDEHQFSFLQWCYGVPQTHLDHMEEDVLPGTLYRCLQIEKKKGFQVFKVDPAAPEQKTPKTIPQHPNETTDKAQLMPYTSAMLASKLSEGSLYAPKGADGGYINPRVCLEGKRFDIFEPRLSKKHIAKGNRFKTAQAWVFRLVPQFFRCKSLGLEYSDEDLVFTFYTLCKRNFQSFEPWWAETGKSLVAGLLSELHTNDGLEYDEIIKKYKSSHSSELYRRLGYNLAMTMDIIDQYALVSKKDSRAMFSSKDELEAILKASHISYSSFMHYMTLLDLKVIYQTDKRSSSKYEYLRDRLVFGTCYYTEFNEAHKNYCKRHGIPYVSMYKLYSGTKAQYNHILQVTDEAIKAMFEFFDKQESNPHPIKQNEEKKPDDEDEENELPEDIPF